MKNIFKLSTFLSALLISINSVSGVAQSTNENEIPYYRFWQGWKKDDLSYVDFHKSLGEEFISAAPQTHAKNGLMAYLVATPPKTLPEMIGRPVSLPDEIALLNYESEDVYMKARETPEGKQYADLHWTIFSKEKSKSSVPLQFQSTNTSIALNQAYDILGKSTNWQEGFTTFFIGVRKDSISPEEFASQMHDHVSIAADAFADYLNAYVMLLTPDYELAFMNWKSKDDLEKAFSTKGAENVVQDAEEFMHNVMWTKDGGRDHNNTVTFEDLINVKFKTRK